MAVIFILQPISTIRTLDYWFPAISIALGVISWMLVAKKDIRIKKKNISTIIAIILFLIFIGLSRFFSVINIQKIISPPNIISIIIFLILLGVILSLVYSAKNQNMILWGIVSLILIIFILIKNEFLAYKVSFYLRKMNDQSTNLAASKEIVWIGYSYISFRIIHTLIESKKRKGIDVTLKTYLIYLFYFPAFLAGPIEKIDNFIHEISSNTKLKSEDLLSGGKRIAIGLFQKFIVADTLAIISINENLSQEVTPSFWMLVMVLAYSLRIYFDFNGYTHIALGISEFLGIKLPENFNKPLRSPTLTIFWNNWHMTLTQWFRTYYFNPLTRFFKSKYKSMNQQILMGFMQISTMILIGLWHGISYNFLVWGAWNGFGLFIQNKFSGFLLKKLRKGKPLWQISKISQLCSTIFTFTFITLGWVWFALPDLNSSLRVFRVLIGRK
ncbi:MAG: MBOAT family O-acyltransferase [Pelolinea sp.]|nr:MBOAT family O-acyltransferase [Pelolinea sp.]